MQIVLRRAGPKPRDRSPRGGRETGRRGGGGSGSRGGRRGERNRVRPREKNLGVAGVLQFFPACTGKVRSSNVFELL